MKKYMILTQQEKVIDILNELKKVFKFRTGDCDRVVQIVKGGQGIKLKKNGKKYLITYENDCEFARAWYLMIRMDNMEEYEHDEICSFEQLQVMLDCSRNAVIKPKALRAYIRYLATCGYHSLQLYTEDTIEVEGEPYYGYMRGAYTESEIKEIDQYCKIFGMELIPCIQTLAHINQITRYERFQEIIDLNDILLAEDEATYEFLDKLIASVAKKYTSRKINIGMDEAHMLGLGKYLDKHGYKERFQIIIRHLERVLEILNKYDFKAMMWSDMFFRLLANGAYQLDEEQIDEALFKLIPDNVELVYWDYYSEDYNHYYNNLKMHYKLSDQIGFAAGAWKWTGFAPENGHSLITGSQAMKACLETGVKNFIVTCWGDNGAEASPFSVLPCLYQYAEAAYNKSDMIDLDGNQRKERNHNFSILTGIPFDDFMKIDGPNQIYNKEEHCHTNPCKYLLYNDVLIGTFDSMVTKDVAKQYESKALELEDLSKYSSEFSYLFQALSSLCNVLSLKSDLGIQIYEAYLNKDLEKMGVLSQQTIPEVIERIEEFQKKFKYQWHKENKSFGFEIQLIRFGGLKERLLYAQNQIILWLRGEIKEIEELEEKRLPFAYYNEKDPSKLNYNLWNTIVSPGVMG